MPPDDADARKSEAAWRVEMLGGLRAVPVEDGKHDEAPHACRKPVDQFRTHKAALLLARLALSPHRAHAREELADLLWPEASTERGRANLSQTLVYLRQALDEPRTGGVFIADHKTVRVSRGRIRSDVAEWEAEASLAFASTSPSDQNARIRAAITSYKGDLLPGFYDGWVCDERNRLTALHDALQDRLQILNLAPDSPTGHRPEAIAADESHRQPATVVNAPLYLTRFFGRAAESSKIHRLLLQEPPTRLLTLIGMGGIGKTRLALEVAETTLRGSGEHAESQSAFGSVTFVALAEARTAAQLESILLQAFGVPNGETNGLAAVANRLNALAAQGVAQTLVVLDNLEQLGELAAPIVARLLADVSSLTILATSRQTIGIPGEREIPVGALLGSSNAALSNDALLFVDRARLVRPDFEVTPENEQGIIALCALLEGVPLAVELAAAWARILTPLQIAARLGKRFDLLKLRGAAVAGGAQKRHQSLYSAIAWSFDLLGPSLKAFFAQLSAFRGGWTAEAAEAITDVRDVSEPLLLLAERSLIIVERGEGDAQEPPRYRMLESLREFAELEWNAEERKEIATRHAAFFLDLAQMGNEAIRGTDQAEWLKRLDAENDNFRAAMAYGIATHNAELTQGLSGAVSNYWERRGYLTEAREWLEAALEIPGDGATASRALALNRLGGVLNYTGPLDKAEEVHRKTLTAYQKLGDDRGIALVWNRIGFVASQRGDNEGAVNAYAEALARERSLGNKFNMAASIVNLGILAQKRQAYGEARGLYAEGLELFRELDLPSGIADAYLNLGAIAVAEGVWDEGISFSEKAGEMFDRLGDRWSRAYIDYNLSVIARHQGRLDDGANLANNALVVCREVGDLSKTGDALRQLGLIARGLGDESLALHRFREALDIYQELGQHASVASCEREIGATLEVRPETLASGLHAVSGLSE